MFRLKQLIKMFLQNILLPIVYAWYARKPVEKGSILFADAHHDEIPFSMRRVYETLAARETGASGGVSGQAAEMSGSLSGQMSGVSGGLSGQAAGTLSGVSDETVGISGGSPGLPTRLTVCVRDFDRMSYGALLRYLLRFMKRYATTEYVFVCDYYLPVASCRKRPETKVVQLWHSCGLMKKIAHDAGDDIPKGYRGNLFGNYTYLTLSAPVCVPVHARALQIPQERIYATGVSRTDYYFDEEWNRRCREAFYEQYPQARGRRIALWAPTFRGNAAMPRLEGLQEIRQAAGKLAEEWYFVLKAHPHIDAHGLVSNCSIPTEELLPVADLLITDYSSVMFDYLLYRKPIILFAPDLERYEAERGFYIDYHELPYPVTQTADELERAVRDCGPSISMGAYEVRSCGQNTEHVPVNEDGALRAESKRSGKQGKSQEKEIDRFREKYVGACDGHATERILKLAGLWQ